MNHRLVTVLLWSCFAFGFGCEGPQHNAQFGQRVPNDMLDYMDHIKADYKFLRVIEKTASYPPSNEDTSTALINYIEVLDQFSNGNGGCATLLSGGPGHNYTTVKFKSKRNHGLDFIIRIFVSKYF